jgi:serine/threonine-protein kinase
VAPGDILAGKYRVEHILGRGAMGLVVAARHLELGELFAVKLLLPEAAAHPQAVERFLREARAAARLKSEHVAKVTDVGRLTDGSPFMVMEHLSGTDLQQHVRKHGPLPAADVVMLALQACEALSEAHSLGIIHRDIKPSNMFLVRRPSGTLSIKILDFGISKQMTQEAVDLTKTSDVFGTPLYMAPEQMARTKAVDARSDVWSMGVVLYELLTATNPFHALTLTEVVARVLQEDAPPPSSLRPDLPRGLDSIVARCLEKRRELRFQTIDALGTALRGLNTLSGGLPLEAVSRQGLGPEPQSLSYPQEAATLSLAAARSPTARVSTPEQIVAPLGANTGASWGATGRPQSRPTRNIGLWVALAGICGTLLVFVFVWKDTRSISQGAEPTVSESIDGSITVAPKNAEETDAGGAPAISSFPSTGDVTDPKQASNVPSPGATAHPTANPRATSSAPLPRRPVAPGTRKPTTKDVGFE